MEVAGGVLIQGDCLVEMKSIEDKSIDMILCDLPY
jgi:DNA modification methylase